MKDNNNKKSADIEELKQIERKLRECEERYRMLVEQSPDNIIIHDLEGRILFTNASRVEVLGAKSPADIIGRNAMEFVHPDDMGIVTEAITGTLEDYKNKKISVKTIEHRFVRLDGTEFFGEATGVPFIYGGELAMQVIVRDVTRRRQAEEALNKANELLESKVEERTVELLKAYDALRESETRYRVLVETIRLGIQENDLSGKITFSNPSHAEVLGYEDDELVGKYIWDFLDSETERAELRRYFGELVRKQPPPTPYFSKNITKDGRSIDVRVDWNYKRDEHGELTGFISIISDITELKRAEQEKQRLQAQLIQAQKMEAIGTLAGGVAHDFNNIMTVVKNMASLALDKASGNAGLKECLEPIRAISDRAVSLVQQLLIFSQNKPVVFARENLNDIITELMSLLNSLVSEDVMIEADTKYGLWDIEADRGRIEQVITNLVVNGRDAMPQGGRIILSTGNITLPEEQAGDLKGTTYGKYVYLTVEDTGCGMDAETRAQIFEPFFTTKSPEGTGLGLSVVYGVIKELDGWIDVNSEPGEGSAFTIYLPALTGAESAAAEARPVRKAFDGKGRRILLVEDDKWVRKSTAMVLADNGYEVFEASNAENAISLFYREKGRFDLILSDVVMPGRSGMEMIKPLFDINPNVPVLLFSGHLDDKAQLKEIIRRGYAYIQKPFEINDLLRAVEETLDSST